mmetsp:Transcript_147231/g.257196  ORF Transcript_147231/g.257196 Transcript_147231/m.257196 type:complete len:220 (-) Transcript_147231:533-1192(-)
MGSTCGPSGVRTGGAPWSWPPQSASSCPSSLSSSDSSSGYGCRSCAASASSSQSRRRNRSTASRIHGWSGPRGTARTTSRRSTRWRCPPAGMVRTVRTSRRIRSGVHPWACSAARRAYSACRAPSPAARMSSQDHAGASAGPPGRRQRRLDRMARSTIWVTVVFARVSTLCWWVKTRSMTVGQSPSSSDVAAMMNRAHGSCVSLLHRPARSRVVLGSSV